jgi:hypothetical protein
MTDMTSARSAWESFYMIIGSSGGALIGLQFVVISLLSDRRNRTRSQALDAFSTPTVVHLTAALVVSAIMSAPWPSVTALSVAIAATAAMGLAYAFVVVWRTWHQNVYEPVWEDWLWYAALPCLSYAALAAAALLRIAGTPSLFMIGASALALLLIGIHNAWDTVTHVVVSDSETAGKN